MLAWPCIPLCVTAGRSLMTLPTYDLRCICHDLWAGGCFWSVELAYQRLPGVVSTSVGYTQGKTKNPTYDEVCSGSTGHTEAVQCAYNEAEISYDELLNLFFSRVDPTTLNRQGNDRGTQVSLLGTDWQVSWLSKLSFFLSVSAVPLGYLLS